MEHKIFSIYDQKAYAYLPPFTLPTAEMAERTFADCINADNHAFAKHPADYTLFELGTYDDNKGEIKPYSVPKVLGTGIEYVRTHQLTGDHQGNGNIQQVSNDPSIQPSTSS